MKVASIFLSPILTIIELSRYLHNNKNVRRKSRNIGQVTTSSSNMDALAMRLCNSLKDHVVAHGNHVKNFEELMCNDIMGDNVKYIIAYHCHCITQNKIPKG